MTSPMDRAALINQLASTVQASDIDEPQRKQLAHTFLTNILVNKNENFTPKQADNIKKSFANWTLKFTNNMTSVTSFEPPKINGKPISLANVTSLPCSWTTDKFWFTSQKLNSDQEEKELIQQNLKMIAEAEFTTLSQPEGGDEKEHLSDQKMLLSISQLARGYAYRFPATGEKISIYSPGIGLVDYKVEEIHLSGGIHAYGLNPKDKEAQPILLFRGTSFYPSGRAAGATIATDFDPLGIGYSSYKAGRERIKNWIETQATQGKKIIIAGHSLGSAYATYAAIDNESNVKTAYGFGATKVSFLYKSKWDEIQKREKDEHKPVILQFNAPGDGLSDFGHVRLATAVYNGTSDGADLPEVEILGKEADHQHSNFFVRALNRVRPKTTAHRVEYLGASVTLWKSKQPEKVNWFGIALRVISFTPAYLLLTASLWTKRALIGTSQCEGLLTWPIAKIRSLTEKRFTKDLKSTDWICFKT